MHLLKNKYKKINKNIRWIRNNKGICSIIVGVMMFPILVGCIYSLPLPQFVAVDSGDLLSYYGVVFGIVSSFVIYRLEINKKEKERETELKPVFVVDVTLLDEENGIFAVRIVNQTQKGLFYLNLYDEFVSSEVRKRYEFKVTYLKSVNELENIEIDYNITMDPDIIDTDGYPKYIQLICDDSYRNAWNCCYYKINEGDKTYYYPREIELI